MARGVLPVTTVVRAGTTPPSQTNADATNKHYINNNDQHTIVEVISSDAGTQTVTVKVNRTTDGLALPDEVCSIPAGATRYIGPWSNATFGQNYNDGSSDHPNSVLLDPSVSTNLKFRAYSVPLTSRSQ